jgi:hypothetical protein
MVRFSDMLGGNGDSQEASAAATPPRDESPEPGPVADPEQEVESAEPEATSTAQSPEDVLDRLTHYASTARASDPPAPEPAVPADETDEPLTAVGDDLLPHPKGEKSKRRRK